MGAITLSVDAELAWGYHDWSAPPARLRDARTGWRDAVDLFETHDVPATWAVVGHLFLEACDGTHPEIPAPPGWFDADPGTSLAEDDLWYAPDLIERLSASTVDHEIACHTFSHVEMGAPETTRPVADAEIRACLAAAEDAGVGLESVVFPRNDVGHRDVLAEHGFECYRGRRPRPGYDDSPLRTLWKLVNWSVGGEVPPVVRPTVDEFGLVNVPASLYLFSFEGLPRAAVKPVWPTPVVDVAKRGIDAACDADGLVHLWLHPHNLCQPAGRERLAEILAYVDRQRTEADLSVRTMADVARRAREGDARTRTVQVT